jgi:hypothetical protein
VTFRLELEPGSSKADCVVGEMKRGRSEIAGVAGNDVFRDWVGDSDWASGWWWDGAKFSLAGKGEWEKQGCGGGAELVGVFKDAPGFYKVANGQSLYMGAAVGNTRYFYFKTFVEDKTTLRVIKEVIGPCASTCRILEKAGSGGRFQTRSSTRRVCPETLNSSFGGD